MTSVAVCAKRSQLDRLAWNILRLYEPARVMKHCNINITKANDFFCTDSL